MTEINWANVGNRIWARAILRFYAIVVPCAVLYQLGWEYFFRSLVGRGLATDIGIWIPLKLWSEAGLYAAALVLILYRSERQPLWHSGALTALLLALTLYTAYVAAQTL